MVIVEVELESVVSCGREAYARRRRIAGVSAWLEVCLSL